MLLLIRLVLAVGGFLIRLVYRPRASGDPFPVTNNSLEWRLRSRPPDKNSSGWHILSLKLNGPYFVSFHREGGIDRLLKEFGLAHEIQTGHREFDNEIFISGDHPAVHRMLSGNMELSEAVRALFLNEISWIQWNGSVLRIRSPYGAVPQSSWSANLETLVRHLQTLPNSIAGRIGATLADKFVGRVLILEAVAYGILGYGIGGIIDMVFTPDKIHFAPGDLIRTGLAFGGGLFLIFVFISLLLLAGSSRAPRLFADVLLSMLLSCLVACYQIAADLNTYFDKGPSRIVEAKVATKHMRTSRSRRGGTRHTYYLVIAPQTVDFSGRTHQLPKEILVSSSEFNAASPGSKIELTVWPGELGFPWISDRQVHYFTPF